MKMEFLKITLLLLLSLPLKGTDKAYPPFMSSSLDFVEKVEMTTDRDVYFINENLFFEGTLNSTHEDWSKVIYVQIVSYNGKVFHQSKHKIDKNNGIEGSIKLPDDFITGYYYLRAYTKWMRNYSQYNYFHKAIFIINSRDNKVLSVSDDYEAIAEIDTIGGRYKTHSNINSQRSSVSEENYIELADTNLENSSISLTRKELVIEYNLGIKRENDTIFDYQYLPEIDGLSITGKVVNDSIGIDLERATVFLSILGESPYSSVMYTDQWGKFYFNIDDYYGQEEVMISISSKDGHQINFLIDNDFCNREIKLPFISPLTLNEEQWNRLQMPNINSQIESQLIKTVEEKHTRSSYEQMFYSNPTLSINIDDYIEMPTLKDYIYEIIPMLGIRYKNEVPRIVIRNSDNRIKVKDYNALIIYDGLFINDVSSLLNVSPKEIERLEVFNQVFILGDNAFGGVVNIVSKNKDISNLELSEAGLFVDYMMLYSDVYNDRLPQKVEEQELQNNNTVLWSATESETPYLVPDREGKYLLVFSKWEDGKLVRQAVNLNVE